MARAEAYLHAKFHLDPSIRLATVHERHRQAGQTGQDRQRTDSIGRTVLQTVAQRPVGLVGAVFRKPAKRESGSCRVIWTDAMGQQSLSGPYYTIVSV